MILQTNCKLALTKLLNMHVVTLRILPLIVFLLYMLSNHYPSLFSRHLCNHFHQLGYQILQNMIDGLGITGYEGIFLRVCEITLSVLRMHRETLMSVLETFIHDPLVEWTKSQRSSGVEVQNPHAQV